MEIVGHLKSVHLFPADSHFIYKTTLHCSAVFNPQKFRLVAYSSLSNAAL